MPAFVVPRRSGVHRVAAIALFRALLSQANALTLDRDRSDALQNVIRNRFKQAQHDHSHRRLRLSFEAGYEAIDRLDAAVAGEQESRDYLLDLLTKAPDEIRQAPPVERSKAWIKAHRTPGEASVEEKASPAQRKPSVLDRPLPLASLSGTRHIPILFNASGIPVLRVSKPQSSKLSGYINSRIKQRQARHDLRNQLEDDLELAKSEDDWEDTLSQHHNVITSGEFSAKWEPRWTAVVAKARWEVGEALNEEKRKNKAMAEQLQGVVDRETELAQKEKAERKAAQWRRRTERQQLRDAVEDMTDNKVPP